MIGKLMVSGAITTEGALRAIPLVDLGAQTESIRGELQEAMERVFSSTRFIGGDEVEGFEEEFATYCRVGHAVGTGNGTDALTLALRVLGVGPGDEVITVPHTFTATAEAILSVGAKPVFVDIESRGMLMDVDHVRSAITPSTRAVIPVHLYGQMVDISPLLELAEQHGLVVVEDAAQAHGAEYNGMRAGAIGHAAAFSFFPGKNLGAFGDAGAVTTSDSRVAERIRMLRDHGRIGKYEHLEPGVNSRLDALQAAVLRVKLAHLERWTRRRQEIAAEYLRLLRPVRYVTTPVQLAGRTHVFHLFVIRVPNRDGLLAHLNARGVGAGIHYPIPLHVQPAYRSLGYEAGAFPHAEQAAAEVLSLPLYPEMTVDMVNYICTLVAEFVDG